MKYSTLNEILHQQGQGRIFLAQIFWEHFSPSQFWPPRFGGPWLECSFIQRRTTNHFHTPCFPSLSGTAAQNFCDLYFIWLRRQIHCCAAPAFLTWSNVLLGVEKRRTHADAADGRREEMFDPDISTRSINRAPPRSSLTGTVGLFPFSFPPHLREHLPHLHCSRPLIPSM